MVYCLQNVMSLKTVFNLVQHGVRSSISRTSFDVYNRCGGTNRISTVRKCCW